MSRRLARVVEGCEKLLGGATNLALRAVQDLTPGNCFDVSGKRHVEARPDSERGDIVIEFAGHQLVQDAATQAKSVQAVAERLVLRHSATGYTRLSGMNPTHKV